MLGLILSDLEVFEQTMKSNNELLKLGLEAYYMMNGDNFNEASSKWESKPTEGKSEDVKALLKLLHNPPLEFQKAIVSAMMSRMFLLKPLNLTAKNSGFASVCFAIVENLDRKLMCARYIQRGCCSND